MVPAASVDWMRTESVSEGPLLRERLVACGLPDSSLHADLRAAGGTRPASPTIRPEISGLFRLFAPLTVNQLHALGDDCMSGALSNPSLGKRVPWKTREGTTTPQAARPLRKITGGIPGYLLPPSTRIFAPREVHGRLPLPSAPEFRVCFDPLRR
jgi:hypothetical protein